MAAPAGALVAEWPRSGRGVVAEWSRSGCVALAGIVTALLLPPLAFALASLLAG